MVQEAVHQDGERGVRQAFDHIARLQVVLTVSVGRQPERCEIVDTIADHERVVIGLGDFVAESRCIRERRPEQSACGPTGIVQDPPPFRIGARVEQVGVVSQHTAIVCVSEEEIDVREEEGRDVLGGNHIVHDVGDDDAEECVVEDEIRLGLRLVEDILKTIFM